jgi:hypothetical protein
MNVRAVVIGEKIEGVTPKRSFVMYSELTDADNKLWLVRGLLGLGEASAVYGRPGCGKSVLVEDMCTLRLGETGMASQYSAALWFMSH